MPGLLPAATFTASKDTTIYDSGTVNGTGGGLFVGTNGQDTNQRGLIAFDLSAIPAGSTVTSVSLRLHVNAQGFNSGADTVSINAVTQTWNEAAGGEGGATSGGGAGVPAVAGDATWFSSGLNNWTSPGGDYNPVASSSLVVDGVGVFHTFTGAGLVSDVQAWVNDPGSNYGWIIRGKENSNSSSKRFSSRENTGNGGANVPLLTVTYDTGITPLPPVPVPPENPVTEAKRILGKILFWDEQLSSNDTVACGTCHIPSAGGTDPRPGSHPGADGVFNTVDDVVGSPGIVSLSSPTTPVNDPVFGFFPQVTSRAAPTTIGAMYTPDHFWDGRATSQFIDPEDGTTVIIASGGALESQAVVPILSSVEMAHAGRTWTDVKNKLATVVPLALATTNVPSDMSAALAVNADYPSLFNAAFGDSAITAARIGMAIATYERTLLPDQSPWDLYIAGDANALSAQQLAGWNALDSTGGGQRCLSCHTPPTFSDDAFYNIGLRPASEDIGREAVTGNPTDTGRFKTPTLRNSGLRKHLMHVGWITDNADAIDFYNAGTADITTIHTQFTADQSALPNGDAYSTAALTPTDEANQNDVAEFLANGLTDPRVAAETFPFDRPTLRSEFSSLAVSDQLKLMTYNIDSSNWDGAQANRIEAIIDVESADVIGLQEVTATPLADLLARIGDDYDFVATTGAGNNNPILIRKNTFNIIANGSTAENEMTDCLTDNSYTNYVVLSQITTGAQFTFHNTHLCSDATTRQAQAVTLVNLIDQNLSTYGGGSFTAGAFNAGVGSVTMDFLIEQVDLPGPVSNPVVLDDIYTTATGSSNPGTDAIVFRTDFITVHSAAIINNPSTVAASAYSPVVSIVEITPTNDQDNDTIPDVSDNCPTIANTDQLNTDGDAFGDACDDDDDGDGLTDIFETSIGTDPLLVDTDSDGLSDFDEINVDGNAAVYTPGLDTDPLDPDTDNDGLLDGEEDLNGNGIIDPNEPSPLLIDTDDDGLTDRYEINTSATDPTSTTVLNTTPGDMNADGNINAGDLILLQREILNPGP